MPWAAAIALGAIVAPPDAAAATAILRQVRIPHRLLKILEGESLLNDASALLIYRVAVGAVALQSCELQGCRTVRAVRAVRQPDRGLRLCAADGADQRPDPGSRRARSSCSSPPRSFVWIIAEKLGLSGILTIVVYAITIARFRSGADAGAHPRAVLCGVGHGIVRAQCHGVRADRHAAFRPILREPARGVEHALFGGRGRCAARPSSSCASRG